MSEETVYEIIALTNCKLTGSRCGAGKTLEYEGDVEGEISEMVPECENCRVYQDWKEVGISISKYRELRLKELE